MSPDDRRWAERRKNPRQKSFLRGVLNFNNQRSVIDCLVRDVSDDGARLIFQDVVSVPDTFDLHIPQKELTFRAHVQWRAGTEVGVLFPQAEGAQGASSELEARVERLEAEIAGMKRLLKKLKAEVDGPDADAI